MRVGEPWREGQALERAALQDLLEGREPVAAQRQALGLELARGLLLAPRGDLLVDQLGVGAADEDVRDRPVGGAELRGHEGSSEGGRPRSTNDAMMRW